VGLRNLYSLLKVINVINSRKKRCGKHVARTKEKIPAEKGKGKRKSGGIRRKWYINIRTDLT
jgi:hypothetical protein